MATNGLDAGLQLYKAQLRQVNEALENQPDDSTARDLLHLRDDLIQLINLTEEDATDNEKTSVAGESNDGICSQNNDLLSPAAETSVDFEDELSAFYKDIQTASSELIQQTSAETQKSSIESKADKSRSETNESDSPNSENSRLRNDLQSENFLDSIENMDDVSGVKCQAPFATEWSGKQYHNAMIKGPVGKGEGESSSSDDIQVKVLFLNPVMQNMKPCPYYLDGNCKFDTSQCRFSHGHIVSLYDLRPFAEPDYTNLEEGVKCLARMADGLWKPGIVDKIEEDYYQVRFLHKEITLTLELHNLLPQLTCEEIDSTVPDSDEDIVAEITPSSNLYSKYGESTSSGEQASLGLWEEHTRGIGSKLMQKMGYKFGEGLGKLAQGRLEPVQILVLPPRKSLDHCMKMREEKGVKTINDRGGVHSLADVRSVHRKRRQSSVFSFLNKTLGDRAKVSVKGEIGKPKDVFGIREGKGQKAAKDFNKEMFQNDEEMKKIETKIKKLRESLRRNQGNSSVEKSLRQKLESLKKSLQDMRDYDSNIKVHKSRMETHRKMTVF